MALQAVTPDAVLTIPGAVAGFRVQTNPSGLATSGVLLLIGESEQGPDYTQEADLSLNFFGPDEISRMQAKYGQGRLVDGARIASQAANDPDIQGAPAGFIVVKTNAPGKASLSLARAGLTAYGTIYDQNWGDPGNLTSVLVEEAPAEVAPVQSFTYIPIPSVSGTQTGAVSMRHNGAAAVTLSSIAEQASPATVAGTVASGSATGLNGLTDTLAQGGVSKAVLTGFVDADTLGVAVSGNQITITFGGLPSAWGVTPATGDTLIIPISGEYGCGEDSCIKGAGSANAGAYVVLSATAATIVAVKIRDNVATGTPTPPVAVSQTAVSTEHTDILIWSAITLKNMTGTSRAILGVANVGVNITGTASGTSLTLALASGTWAAKPSIGDYIYMPGTALNGAAAGAPAAWHASGANGGYYQVTASTTASVTMTRLSSGNPASFAATAIAAITNLICKRPAIDGVGKSMEVYDGAGSINVNTQFYTAAGTAVSWLSTTASPVQTVSAAELEVRVSDARQSNSVSEEMVMGGDIMLLVGYLGTTCTMTITSTTLTTTIAGGSGSNLSINLKTFKTIGDLAAYISSQTGYTASAGNNLLAQAQLYDGTKLTLDKGTFNIGSTHGNRTGRIKRDAWAFYATMVSSSLLIQIGNPAAPATAGLPEAQALSFLNGGTRGATTNANIVAALAACERTRANFVCPLFSQDATLDIVDGETDAASSYTIASIHANTKTHVLRMSTIKSKRNRQAFLSIKDTFSGAIAAANAMASFRVAMIFQGFKAQSADGSITTFQPWAGAVYAAGMQAAGFYRSIMNKAINTSGVVSTDSSFDANSDTQVEQALLDGLLPARLRPTGGFAWISDQTTYAVDSNFVFNSVQAVYAADLISLTTAQIMEQRLVGQSLADVSAASAAALFANIMSDLKRLKLITSSDDAPSGFKNAVFKLVGNTLFVSAEIKLANALAFIPISFTISEVIQTATI